MRSVRKVGKLSFFMVYPRLVFFLIQQDTPFLLLYSYTTSKHNSRNSLRYRFRTFGFSLCARHSSLDVFSPRSTCKTTFALNSALYWRRFAAIIAPFKNKNPTPSFLSENEGSFQSLPTTYYLLPTTDLLGNL